MAVTDFRYPWFPQTIHHLTIKINRKSRPFESQVSCVNVNGMAWHGMAWHGMAWHGMAWHGMAFGIP